MKRNIRIKWKNIFLLLSLAICLIIFCLFNYKIITWSLENDKIKENVQELIDNVNINIIEDTKETEIVSNSHKKDEKDPYWDYIKTNLIDIDFAELKKINSSTVGWIQVAGTNINYPFVQTTDNDYYLTHSFDKSKNSAGWVFMDYRNNIQDFDKNTILYAHARKNQTMFGSLEKVLDKSWQDNQNHIIKISTEANNTLWQIFSVYVIPSTSDYLQIKFENNEEFLEFATNLLNRSIYDFKTDINTEDKIITLSTCYKKNDRIVVHAKLIKASKK